MVGFNASGFFDKLLDATNKCTCKSARISTACLIVSMACISAIIRMRHVLFYDWWPNGAVHNAFAVENGNEETPMRSNMMEGCMEGDLDATIYERRKRQGPAL